MKTSRLINHVSRRLGLKYPIKLTIYKGPHPVIGDDFDGFYYYLRRSHRIVMYQKPDRGFYNVLAHEIAHALVQEVWGGSVALHGSEYKEACTRVQAVFNDLGIEVEHAFMEGYDL